MPSRLAKLLAILTVAILAGSAARPAVAHVGSPDVFFEGQAGPYPVRVVVRPPTVVPGRAEVAVRGTKPGLRITRVAVQPVIWNAGREGVPPAEPARPVTGDPSLWTAQLWLMRPTSYSVRVEVGGAAGTGTLLVPVVAVATQRLPMQRGMALVLAGLGVFLVAGALTAVGAAVRESVVPPGEDPGPRRRRLARWAMLGTALLLGLALWGGRTWWGRVDAAFARTIYRPFPVKAQVEPGGSGRTLTLAVAQKEMTGREWTPLIPDHGKLLHLFLVPPSGEGAFAHLHPEPLGREDDRFRVALPPLPAGRYRLYADVTHENGFAETLTAKVDLPPAGTPAAGTEAPAAPAPDPDDSYRVDPGVAQGPGGTFALGDGLTLTWDAQPGPRSAKLGADAGLRFLLRGPDGRPAPIEPYMGMLSHAAVVRDEREGDGPVFVHLHPDGTVSMAALQFFAEREKTGGKGMEGMEGMAMSHTLAPDGVLAFPWSFPQPGRYHLWVQVKSGGRVRTGVFAVEVKGSGLG
jgi:hypothetical protein